MQGWLTIEELRDRIDHYRSIEWALCSHLGAWAGDDDDQAARRQFAEASARHAWHLAMWDERRPQINTVEPAPAPSPSGHDAELARATTTEARREIVERITADLGGAYLAHQAGTNRATDPATAEVLRRILA